MLIAVIDGQGGGIGRTIVEKLKAADLGDIEVIALGTNSAATGQMLRAGADEGATGENAIVCNVADADVIIGVVGILVANSMMGEMTPAMARAIGESGALKLMLPLNRCNIHVAGLVERPIGKYIDMAIDYLREYIADGE
ncbi:MAG: DUF3842 family protein [Anaerovoracaceae bacterium]|nr:DUF3842 family protein [Anaerovoracaceae bacterium]